MVALCDRQECLPSAEVRSGAVLDDGTLVVIGGHSNEEEFGDVWALGAADETQWVKREPAGQAPRVRGGHSVVYDPNHGLVVFGGISHERGGYLADVQVLAPDLVHGSPCAQRVSCRADGTSTVVLAPGHRMLVFGGFGVQPPPEEEEDEDEDEDEHEDDEVKEGGKADVSRGRTTRMRSRDTPREARDVVLRLTSDGSPTSTL